MLEDNKKFLNPGTGKKVSNISSKSEQSKTDKKFISGKSLVIILVNSYFCFCIIYSHLSFFSSVWICGTVIALEYLVWGRHCNKYRYEITFFLHNGSSTKTYVLASLPNKSITDIISDGYMERKRGLYTFWESGREVSINENIIDFIEVECGLNPEYISYKDEIKIKYKKRKEKKNGQKRKKKKDERYKRKT